MSSALFYLALSHDFGVQMTPPMNVLRRTRGFFVRVDFAGSIRRLFGRALRCSFCIALFGCAGGATMLQTGPSRRSIPPSEVKAYLIAPPKFEAIGMVSATDSSHWMRRDHLQKQILNELKARAAKVGANGLLIKDTSTGEEGQSITALAIYVP